MRVLLMVNGEVFLCERLAVPMLRWGLVLGVRLGLPRVLGAPGAA